MGTPLRAIVERCGGVRGGRSVKAILSGVSNPVLTDDALDAPISYEGFESLGSGLGAGGFIVYDDTACMVRVARDLSRFLAVESCGQCPPCKLGSSAITELLTRIDDGHGRDADVAEIAAWSTKVTDGNRCYLAVEERVVVESILRTFAREFAEHLDVGRCPRPRDLPLPVVTDLSDGTVTYVHR
jgi:NADH-quinone oxidoreductase subunit F